jgi:hypothetical protein
MALVSCAYQYWFYLLLQPYRPIAVHAIISFFSLTVSLVVLLLKREKISFVAKDVMRGFERVWPLMTIPLLAVVVFSGFFAVNGLEMLSGLGDEFAYVEISRQIMDHLFTRDNLDFPWGRADHYLSDVIGHSLAYARGMRLGPNFLLADLSSVFGLSLEKAFPLLMGVSIAIGTASLALLELFVRRSRLAIFAAQFAFATSWLLVMLHFQGSLSNMTTLGLRLGGLCFILWTIASTRQIAPMMLAGIMGAGWLVLYYESIGFGLALPLLVGLTSSLVGAVGGRIGLARRFAVRSVAVVIMIYALQSPLFETAVRTHIFNDSRVTVTQPDENFITALVRGSHVAANFLPPVLGYGPLYTDNAAIPIITRALLPYSLLTLLSFAGLAALGFWRRLPGVVGIAWASVPFSLAAVSLVAIVGQNLFLHIRSAQMTMPHIFVGLSLLVFARRRIVNTGSKKVNLAAARRGVLIWRVTRRGIFDFRNRGLQLARLWLAIRTGLIIRIGAGFLWAGMVVLNGFAAACTIDFVNRHSLTTDLSVRHFDPDAPLWVRLREFVANEDDAPVLISGFHDGTLDMIGLGLRSVPHLVGTSIASTRSQIDPNISFTLDYSGYYHWLTNGELSERAKALPTANWPPVYSALLTQTRKAIVPVSGAYPSEWGQHPSLFGVRGLRFPNLCDILERDEPAFIAEAEPAATGQDELGLFWMLSDTVKVLPRLRENISAVVEIQYTGSVPRILIDGVQENLIPRKRLGVKPTIVELDARLGPSSVIEISASPDTRLRSVSLYSLY